MKIPVSIVLIALICACHSEEPCNQRRALKIATAHAKAKLANRYVSDEKIVVESGSRNFKFEFFDERFLGGGLDVEVDKRTCEITESLLTQ